MTQLTATFTVTIKTKPDGDYYFDHDDLVRNVVPWIEGGLDDRDDIAEVTITEQATEEAHAELRHARAALARIRQMADYWEQHLPEVIRTPAVVSALRAAMERAESAAVSAAVAPPTDRAAVLREAEAELYVLLRKAGEPRDEAQALIDRHRDEVLRRAELRSMADETATQTPPLVHVGWWCWRGGNHGHLAAMACRSDNVPIHVPAEWEDDMRAVIQRLEDEDDEPDAGARQAD